MANILSNFEGWGPTEVAYKKKKCTVFPNYFRLRTEGVLPAPASQSLIYLSQTFDGISVDLMGSGGFRFPTA